MHDLPFAVETPVKYASHFTGQGSAKGKRSVPLNAGRQELLILVLLVGSWNAQPIPLGRISGNALKPSGAKQRDN